MPIILSRILPVLLLVFLGGCAGTSSTRDGDNAQSAQVYPLGMEDALLIMRTAIEAEFPDGRIEDIFEPYRGYQAKFRFMLDVETVSVYAIPASGRGPDGSTVRGLVFETHYSGTMPFDGSSKSKAVFRRVVEGAERLAGALPKVN